MVPETTPIKTNTTGYTPYILAVRNGAQKDNTDLIYIFITVNTILKCLS
jgi:hypothetical protein